MLFHFIFDVFFLLSCMTSALLLWMNWCIHSLMMTATNTQLSSNTCDLCIPHVPHNTINIARRTKRFHTGKILSNNLNIGIQLKLVLQHIIIICVKCTTHTPSNSKRDFGHICVESMNNMYQCIFLNSFCFPFFYLFLSSKYMNTKAVKK